VIAMGWPAETVGWDVQEAWVESAANALAWGIFGWGAVVATVVLLAMLGMRNRRRSFWCRGAQREVEVEFQERGVPGFVRTRVLTCSVFDPPTAVSCHRDCVDPDRRLLLPPTRSLA
jgi:hypothetical protein